MFVYYYTVGHVQAPGTDNGALTRMHWRIPRGGEFARSGEKNKICLVSDLVTASVLSNSTGREPVNLHDLPVLSNILGVIEDGHSSHISVGSISHGRCSPLV